MTNTNEIRQARRVEVLSKGKSVSGGPLWHVKVDGVLAGCVVGCFEWYMTDVAQGPGITRRHGTLEEATAYLVDQLVRYHV